uniref:C2H2-type domain-containing protein n=1 Tax=Globodera rostochiensis TaxID=31243 RepID=A0A914HXJ7_GLORO
MKGRVTGRQQRACDDGASSGARRRAEFEILDRSSSPISKSKSRKSPNRKQEMLFFCCEFCFTSAGEEQHLKRDH